MRNNSYAPHDEISRYSIREFKTGAEPFMVAMMIINIIIEKGFNRLVHIIRGAEDSVVFLQIRRVYVGVGAVKVIQDGMDGGEAVSDVLVLERVDENFVNSLEKNL